jgi:hypothetical protein
MKLMSATLVSLALMASPVAAETQYRSMLSGSVKIEVTSQDAKGLAQPKPGETLTIQIVQPVKRAGGDAGDAQQQLQQCAEKWNRKLKAYEAGLPKLQKYLGHYAKSEDDPAQRLPKSLEPQLTRTDYRACIYECLGDRRATCPGGWPAEDVAKD